MPDWMQKETQRKESVQGDVSLASSVPDDSLSPVELPSWVQAMRPVDSAIEGVTDDDSGQSVEQ
jgi:hypothetical protein